MSEGWVRARAAPRPWDVSLEWRSGAAYAVKPESRGTRGPGPLGDLSGQQRELQTVGSPWGSRDLDVMLLQQGQARDSARSRGSEPEFSCGHGRPAAWGPGQELQGGPEGPGRQPRVRPLVGQVLWSHLATPATRPVLFPILLSDSLVLTCLPALRRGLINYC